MPSRFKYTPLALSLLTLHMPAVAEEATASASASVASPAPVQELDVITVSAKAEEAGYVARHSVTATKTDTPLRDVPQSITVVTAEQVRDQGIQGLADAVRFVPGVNMSQGEGNRDTVVFRGNSSTGDFFLDGIRDDVQYIRDLYNIDRVEVLKGSNAMIFGRGGSGGVINRVSKQAGWDNENEVSVTAGSWNNRRITLDVGQGINEQVAARVTALHEDSESYRDGFELKRSGINPTATFKLSDDTQVALGYEFFKDERTADRGIPSFQGKPFETNASTFFGDPAASPVSAEVNIFNAMVEHNFSDQVKLINRTRLANYDKSYQNVYPDAVNAAGTMVTIKAYNNATERQNIFNQTDLTYTLGTGSIKHKILTGVELGKQETDNFRNTGFFGSATSVQVPVSNPRATPTDFHQSATDADNHSEATVSALYVQDQIEFSPQFQAILGLRYDRFDTDVRNNRNGATFASSDNLMSPRAGLIYKPLEELSLYTSYSVAYVPRSGDQLASLSLTNQALDPEEFTNIELGAKWDVSENFSATAAVFELTRSNVAVMDPANTTLLILAEGKSQKTKGLELSLTGQVTDAWSVIAGYGYMDAEITKEIRTSPTATTPAGNKLANTPNNTFSLWNRYDFNPQLGVGLGIIDRSDIYAAIDNAVTVPGFTRVDAAVFYKFNKNLQTQLNVENVLDKKYYVSANSNTNITPGSPLALRVSLTAKF